MPLAFAPSVTVRGNLVHSARARVMKLETGALMEGKYRIVRAIGTGGMSVVFGARTRGRARSLGTYQAPRWPGAPRRTFP